MACLCWYSIQLAVDATVPAVFGGVEGEVVYIGEWDGQLCWRKGEGGRKGEGRERGKWVLQKMSQVAKLRTVGPIKFLFTK